MYDVIFMEQQLNSKVGFDFEEYYTNKPKSKVTFT